MSMTNQLTGVSVLVASLSILATGCATTAHSRANIPESLELQSIAVDGVQRTYYIHFPSGNKSRSKLPLVLVLHGGGKGDGLKAAERTGFTSLADKNSFIVVYPNGIDAYWRDGRGYSHRGKGDDSVDDVGFLSKLIDHLVQDSKADPKRVYVTGNSNGGMMALRLGCEITSKLAAIAPVIANIPKKIIGACQPKHPLPVLLMNGTDDPLVPYEGGYVHFRRKKMGEVVSTDETIAFWVKNNHCNTKAKVVKLPDHDPRDHSTVTVSTYSGPTTQSEVVLYAIVGGGHTLPGSNAPDAPRLVGRKNNDIDSAAVIWEFFSRHSR